MNYLQTKNTERGFTLIELLVVISIIALLSVIVMASMEDARNRARNSARNQLVQQYLNALELYRTDNNKYPATELSAENLTVCLGNYEDTACYGSRPNDPVLIQKLEQYIPGMPINNHPLILSNGGNVRGPIYRCLNNCRDFQIRWVLKGASQKCIGGVTGDPFFGETVCEYNSGLILGN